MKLYSNETEKIFLNSKNERLYKTNTANPGLAWQEVELFNKFSVGNNPLKERALVETSRSFEARTIRETLNLPEKTEIVSMPYLGLPLSEVIGEDSIKKSIQKKMLEFLAPVHHTYPDESKKYRKLYPVESVVNEVEARCSNNQDLKNFVKEMSGDFSKLKGSSLSHGDASIRNWLFDDLTQKPILVDWGSACLSTPELDIGGFNGYAVLTGSTVLDSSLVESRGDYFEDMVELATRYKILIALTWFWNKKSEEVFDEAFKRGKNWLESHS